MNIKIRDLTTTIFIMGCVLFGAGALQAGIGARPTITEIAVSPNSVTKGVYTVVNDGAEIIHVKVEPEDWLKRRTGASGIPIEDWLTITPMEFDIEPQGIKEVEYVIAPPPDAEGELVAMIFFATSAPTKGAFGITSRFGVSIYAAIEGSIDLGCKIDNIKVKRNIQEKKEGAIIDKGLIFIIDVENQGNVHLRPTGDIIVTGEDGSKYDVKIGRGFPVFPGTCLSYAIRWDKKDISPGRYEALIRLDYGDIYNIDKTVERKASFLVEKDGKISF